MDLFLVVTLVVVIDVASLFLLLGLPLKCLTIVGVCGEIFPMQETVELLFSVCSVACFATTFLAPAGFVLLNAPLLVDLFDGESLNADLSLSHILVNSLIVCSCTLNF